MNVHNLIIPRYMAQQGLTIIKTLFLFQLLSSIVVVGGTNVAGALTHHPRELAQRQAFLETRQCVEARLTTQRENQQQVRRRLEFVKNSRNIDLRNMPIE